MPNWTSVIHKYFDQVFLVNLDHHIPEKLKAYWALKRAGIVPKLWKAYDGYSFEGLEDFSKYQEKQLGDLHFIEFSHLEENRSKHFIESPGALGYIRTYEQIINYSIENGFKRILILEDDVILDTDFETKFDRFITSIPLDWKLIQLGASQYNWDSVSDIEESKANGYYQPCILETFGSFAIGINLQVGNELLQNLAHLDGPFDHIPLGQIYEKHRGQCFVCFPNIVLPDVRSSSIRHSRNQIEHAEMMKWKIDNFIFPQPLPQIALVFDDISIINFIKIGNSNLEKVFQINWLYFVNDHLRPIHNLNSPSLRIGNVSTKKYKTDSIKLPSGINCPSFYINLKRVKNETYIIEGISKYVMEGEVPDFLNPISEQISETSNLVSVIIPTYKRSDNLMNAVESALGQSNGNIEVIVVDDNEPDSEYRHYTRSLIENLKTKDPRLIYLEHDKNLNGSAARNTGLFASKGSFIAFLDDDDIYLPNKVELCLKKLLSLSEKYGAVYGGFVGWNSPKNDLHRYKDGNLTLDLFRLNYKEHYLHTNTALYRKSALLKINGFDDSFKRQQDLEMNLRFFSYYQMGTIPEVVAKLKPELPPNSNQLFGKELFRVKKQYLSRFKSLISIYPQEIQLEIYEKNWTEVKKTFSDEKDFFNLCLMEDESGISHYLVVSLSKNDDSPFTELKQLKQELELKRSALKDVIEYRDTLLKEKEWYEITYESLPGWWKKVGSIIRKLKGE